MYYKETSMNTLEQVCISLSTQWRQLTGCSVGVQLNPPISDLAGWETRKGKSEGEQFIVMSAS